MPVRSVSRLSDEAFGWWLCGLIDGEGCFTIQRDRRDGSYRCHFALKLRDDDAVLLAAVRERTGLGKVFDEKRRAPSRACRSWRVSSQRECVALCGLLDGFGLQSKKALDYAIWREAVAAWVARERRRGSRWGPAKSGDDWSALEALRNRLRVARAYS